MAMGRPKAGLVLSGEQRGELEKHVQFPLASGGTGDSGAHCFAERGGKDEPTDCRQLGLSKRHRGKWRRRFVEQGIDGTA